MKKTLDIYYTAEKDSMQMLDIYAPDTASFPTLIYFHGGGIESGNRKNDARIGDYLANHGIGFVSVEYRMFSTGAKYPDFIEDCAAAVYWVKTHIKEYGGSEKLFVGGSSAGGYFSMMLCFDKKYLGKYGIFPTDISGYIHDAGQPTTHFNVLKYSGYDSRRVIIDEKAPLYYIGLDKEYAPMLIIVSDNDMENRPEQTALLMSTLKHFKYDMSKIEYKIMHGTHCQYVGALDENGDSVLGKIAEEYIKKTV